MGRILTKGEKFPLKGGLEESKKRIWDLFGAKDHYNPFQGGVYCNLKKTHNALWIIVTDGTDRISWRNYMIEEGNFILEIQDGKVFKGNGSDRAVFTQSSKQDDLIFQGVYHPITSGNDVLVYKRIADQLNTDDWQY